MSALEPTESLPLPLSVADEALLGAWNHGVHVDHCPMLHPDVRDDAWQACTCWFGKARSILLAAGLIPSEPRV